MKPLKTQRLKFKNLPETHQKAILLKMGEYEVASADNYADRVLRVETYKTADVKKLIGEIWGWSTTIKEVDCKHDVDRIKKIKKLIPQKGQWPYISHWAVDMQDLMETDVQPDGEISVPNHGDGWHRCIAAFELNLPTIDIVFFEGFFEGDKS